MTEDTITTALIIATANRLKHDLQWGEFMTLLAEAARDPTPENVKAALDAEFKLTGDCEASGLISDTKSYASDPITIEDSGGWTLQSNDVLGREWVLVAPDGNRVAWCNPSYEPTFFPHGRGSAPRWLIDTLEEHAISVHETRKRDFLEKLRSKK